MKEKLLKVIEAYLAEHPELFLVDVIERKNNGLNVEVDTLNGITMDDCIHLNRYIREQVGEELDNYDIEVGSPGLTKPFKVKQQYQKNVGREIELVLTDGNKRKATLLEASNDAITIEYTVKTKENKKVKYINLTETINYADIKSAHVLLSFK